MSRSFWRVAPISLPEAIPIFLMSWPLMGKRGMDHLRSSDSSSSSPWYFSSSHTLLWESNSRFWEDRAQRRRKINQTAFVMILTDIFFIFSVLKLLWGPYWCDPIRACLQQSKQQNVKQPSDCPYFTSKSCSLMYVKAHFPTEDFKQVKRTQLKHTNLFFGAFKAFRSECLSFLSCAGYWMINVLFQLQNLNSIQF